MTDGKERTKKYRLAHPERVKETKRKWAKEHPEKVKEYSRKCWQKNKIRYAARSKQYYEKNKEKILIKHRLKNKENYQLNRTQILKRVKCNRKKLKLEVMHHYSSSNLPQCVCCGETNIGFLTIDHINNDGAKQRKNKQIGGNFYRWLKNNKFPEGFQVLCYNCNLGRAKNNGVCPHEEEK